MSVYFSKSYIGIITLGAFYCISCTEQTKTTIQKSYYPNGKIHIEQTVKNGLLHGQYLCYYPNGKIEYRYQYVEGKLTGDAILYYTNGSIKSRAKMLNDSLDGLFQIYYRNGIKKERGFYMNGIKTGAFILFDSVTGKPVERHKYTNDGRLFFADRYDESSKPFDKGFIPLFSNKDTVKLGSSYNGSVYFGCTLPGEITMVIGKRMKLKNVSDPYNIVDTFSIVRPDSRGVFHFSYLPNPAKVGKNTMYYTFRHKSALHDSLSVDGLSGTHSFWVVETNKIQ